MEQGETTRRIILSTNSFYPHHLPLPLYRLYQRLTSRLREPKFTWLEVLA